MGEGMTAMEFLAANQAKKAQRAAAARAQQAAARKTRTHKVYEYLFPDGAIYIGVTCLSLNRREQAHKRDFSVVGRRLVMFPEQEPARTVLYEFDDREEAEQVEKEVIQLIPEDKRLNVVDYKGVRPMDKFDDWRRRVEQGLEEAPPGGYL